MPITATHRAQRTRGRLSDHVWSATMDAGRSAAQPHARRSVNDGHEGNNDVQRAARARRGSSGRSPAGRRGPHQPPSRASSRALRARAVGWLPHHAEVDGGRRRGWALARDAEARARPWCPARPRRRQGPSRGYCARAMERVDGARATWRAKKRRGRRRAAGPASSPSWGRSRSPGWCWTSPSCWPRWASACTPSRGARRATRGVD